MTGDAPAGSGPPSSGAALPHARERAALAAELRTLRRGRGLTGTELAQRAGMSQSKVSKIETGRVLPSRADVEAIGWALGLPAPEVAALADEADRLQSVVTSYRILFREGMGAGQEQVRERERGVRELRSLQLTFLPGLLQTAEYARWIFTVLSDKGHEADVPRAVAARLARHEALYDPDRRFVFVLHEAALRMRYGPASFLPQLDRIATLSTLSNVEIGIIPSTAALPRPLLHGFSLHDDRIVYVELLTSEVTVEDPEDIATYRRYHDLFASVARFGDGGRRLLDVIREDRSRQARNIPIDSPHGDVEA